MSHGWSREAKSPSSRPGPRWEAVERTPAPTRFLQACGETGCRPATRDSASSPAPTSTTAMRRSTTSWEPQTRRRSVRSPSRMSRIRRWPFQSPTRYLQLGRVPWFLPESTSAAGQDARAGGHDDWSSGSVTKNLDTWSSPYRDVVPRKARS